MNSNKNILNVIFFVHFLLYLLNMKAKYNIGQVVYILGNNRFIFPMMVINYSYGLYTLKYIYKRGGIRLKEDRIFPSEFEASICIEK